MRTSSCRMRSVTACIFATTSSERISGGQSAGPTSSAMEGLGDANALPLTTGDAVLFKEGAMRVSGVRAMTFAELRRLPAPKPRAPEESLKALHLRPDLRADVVASEPLVQDPMFVDWDADGLMWMVEKGDYPFFEDKSGTLSGHVNCLDDSSAECSILSSKTPRNPRKPSKPAHPFPFPPFQTPFA